MLAATIRFFQVFTSSSEWIPGTDRVLAWAAVVFLGVAAVTAFAPVPWAASLAPLSQLLSTLIVFVLIGASIRAGRRGSGAAWVFLAAWSAFLLGGFSRSFVSFDLVERSVLFEYALYFGSVLEALILALGLSHRVGQLRERRIRAEHEQQRAMTLANQDPLTGVYNRRFFENYLDTVLDDSRRVETEGALILLDIDHFKEINDTHGHEAGDMMLRALARRCLRELREGDALCRMGGDEFAIVLRTSSGEGALDVARRVHTAVTERPVHYEQTSIDLAISVGVLAQLVPGQSRSDVLRRVDRALYRAKENGRNRVEATRPEDHDESNGSTP
jgi:diguanylate cyclase (GGDEF)-like protein